MRLMPSTFSHSCLFLHCSSFIPPVDSIRHEHETDGTVEQGGQIANRRNKQPAADSDDEASMVENGY